MNVEHRTWFPFIMVGITLAILVAFFAMGEPRASQVMAPSEDVPSAPTQEEYQAEVLSVLATYETEGDAQAAYDSLLEMRVPVADKDLHLELVIAFAELEAGKTVEGTARLDILREQTDWLK